MPHITLVNTLEQLHITVNVHVDVLNTELGIFQGGPYGLIYHFKLIYVMAVAAMLRLANAHYSYFAIPMCHFLLLNCPE
jgi:hypothetical protein